MTLDIESVLAGHVLITTGQPRSPSSWNRACSCDEPMPWDMEKAAPAHRAHIAAVLREQIAAWLESEAVEREIVQQANAEDDRHFAAGSSHGLGAGEAVSLTLDALAAQVACVDPSRSESGSTDPEVRQSADRTSSPSRAPGEGS